ncbi:unnamed protein product [Anisakis simplex]|uniref:Histidine kinase n=1 Tax=Anisakis simplex TaxID=6269 RepID=A0A0M3J4A6_ANISI|nr:unnamed protein product [Anisakis simplex]
MVCSGIWLAVFVLVFLSVIASVMLLVGVNLSSFVCQPLEDPLSRPDIISLGDRIVNLWKTERIEHDLPLLSYGTSSANSSQSLITSIIDGCSLSQSSNNYNNNNNNNNNNINTNKPAQKTFYEIFQLDKKYRLLNVTARDLNGYQKLNDFFDNLANQMRINIETHMKNNNNNNINNILSKNIQKLTEMIRKTSSIFETTGETTRETDQENIIKLIEKVNKTLELLDFMPNTSVISDQLTKANLNQRVIQAVLNRLRVIELNSSEPLRNRIKTIVSNVSTISSKLSNLSQPLSLILNRLEESESMLQANFNVYLQKVIKEFLMNLKRSITDYIEHVQRAVSVLIYWLI